MYQSTLNDVNDVIGIIEQVYVEWSEDLKKKLNNIKRINEEMLVKLIEIEAEKGNIKEKKDIIKYIEQIIQD